MDMSRYKKLLVSVLVVGLLALNVLSIATWAKEWYGSTDLKVSFGTDKKMHSNLVGNKNENEYTTAFDDTLTQMQPGDTAYFTLALSNEYGQNTTWYMKNSVIHSLENSSGAHDSGVEGATAGGAYSYKLIYTDPAGATSVLFDSDQIGGEIVKKDQEGLKEATNSLEDYLKLGDIGSGKAGKIDLTVMLDGETQGNAYQDTLADLRMQFAVELSEESPTKTPTPSGGSSGRSSGGSSTTNRTTVVKTGDDTNMSPYFIAAAVSGALLLILGIVSVLYRRRSRKEDES